MLRHAIAGKPSDWVLRRSWEDPRQSDYKDPPELSIRITKNPARRIKVTMSVTDQIQRRLFFATFPPLGCAVFTLLGLPEA